MKNFLILFFGLVSLFVLSSCYCDKIYVGDVNENDEVVHVASVRNTHFIEGAIVKKHNVKDYIGDTKDYVIANKHTFGDLFISGLTFGIYTPTTTKYYVKKNHPRVVVEEKKSRSKAYKGYLK